MYRGWYQVAYERELGPELTPAAVARTPLVVVRTATGLRAIDAACPHRGAHLGHGGRLDGDAIVCPFHGHRVALDAVGDGGFCAREHRTLAVGGLVFALLGADQDRGFAAHLAAMDRTRYFVPGFTLRVRAPAELVVENGFDHTHFHTVHGILNEPAFALRESLGGEFAVEGVFEIPPSPWQTGAAEASLRVPYVARAFSPGIVVSEMGGPNPYAVITCATPGPEGDCAIRLSLAVPAAADGRAPGQDLCRYLLDRSRAGLAKDQLIWENLVPGAPSRLTPADAVIVAFRAFCRGLTDGETP